MLFVMDRVVYRVAHVHFVRKDETTRYEKETLDEQCNDSEKGERKWVKREEDGDGVVYRLIDEVEEWGVRIQGVDDCGSVNFFGGRGSLVEVLEEYGDHEDGVAV